jgi:conjugal transfer pilus assembly protein TraB
MSDKSANGLGIFVNRKADSSKSAPAPASTPSPQGKQKDVQKRWLYVGVGVLGVVVLSTSIFSEKKMERPEMKKPTTMVNVTPPNADKAAFEANFAKELETVKNNVATLTAENSRLGKRLEDAQENAAKAARLGTGAAPSTPALTSGIVPPPSRIGNSNTGGIGLLNGKSDVPPPPPIVPSRLAPSSGSQAAEMPPLSAMPPSVAPPSTAPIVFELKDSSANAAGASGAAGTPGLPTVNAKTTYKKNESAGLLPAGSFAPVVLLNGVDAGTSAATQANPMPVLMNITEQATLPGAAKYKLRNCFVLGNGYGDLSAERVYVRFNRLSCVDKSDRLVLSQEVAGYLVDSDGKLGLRGKVVDRQGARLGKAMLAGFAQGLSQALGAAQGTVTSNLATGSAMSTIQGGAALRSSGLTGASTAAQQLSEFYLKEAQSIFPVVSVDTGRTGTIVFSNSYPLNWTSGESQFVSQTTPNAN